MNSNRHSVPTQFTTARRRLRGVEAVILFGAALMGTISCSDGGVTQPLLPASPVAGLKAQYDSVAPQADKMEPLPSYSRAASLLPSASASGAGLATSVSSIAFAPEAGLLANQLPGCDDCIFGGTPGFPIGFSFNYYGTNYTTFWISSNGFVAFSRPTTTNAGCCHGRQLPLFDAVNNMVAIAWTDLNPKNGQMSFETRGEAPRRRLIVNYSNVPVVGEGTKAITAQMILFEGLNTIELHTTSQPSLSAHHATQGVENAPATAAAFVAGRVATNTYSLVNDAVRFTGEPVNAVPVALPGGNAGVAPNKYYEGVEGAAVQFEGSGIDLDNDQLTFSWDFDGDGEPDANTAKATYTYANDGTYSALLKVSDGRGGVGEARVNVQIANAAPVVNAGSDVRINSGETASFSGTFSDAGVNDNPWHWTWNYGTDNYLFDAVDNQAAPILGSHRYCKAGTFTAKLTVRDNDGSSGSDELVVTVEPLAVQIMIQPNMIILNGTSHGLINVTIFSRPGLDATTLDPSQIKLTGPGGKGTSLARTGGGLWHWDASADRNGDGLLDVAAAFRRDELVANGDLTLNSTEVRLTGVVGNCGDVLGKAPVRVKVQAKDNSAASTLKPGGAAAEPMEPPTQ